MWDKWKMPAGIIRQISFVRPWLDTSIIVIGNELIKVVEPREAEPKGADRNAWASCFMIGSAMQADAHIWLAPGESHAKQMWRAGSGQPWPSKSKANPDNCTGYVSAVARARSF
jgi:hypothetical protein